MEKADFLPRKLPHLHTLGAIETKLATLSADQEVSIFIISTVKDESRMIFEALQKMSFLQ